MAIVFLPNIFPIKWATLFKKKKNPPPPPPINLSGAATARTSHENVTLINLVQLNFLYISVGDLVDFNNPLNIDPFSSFWLLHTTCSKQIGETHLTLQNKI